MSNFCATRSLSSFARQRVDILASPILYALSRLLARALRSIHRFTPDWARKLFDWTSAKLRITTHQAVRFNGPENEGPKGLVGLHAWKSEIVGFMSASQRALNVESLKRTFSWRLIGISR